MTTPPRQEHWRGVYAAKHHQQVSWYQPAPTTSLQLLQLGGDLRGRHVIDVGSGASTLADHLLDLGARVHLLDLAAQALEVTRQRLDNPDAPVTFQAGDVLTDDLGGPFDAWHDRAVFHFLTDPHDQARYREQLRRHLKPGGLVVVGTFADDGPERCSNLPVQRYAPEALASALGPDLTPLHLLRDTHLTPGGNPQRFAWIAATWRPA